MLRLSFTVSTLHNYPKSKCSDPPGNVLIISLCKIKKKTTLNQCLQYTMAQNTYYYWRMEEREHREEVPNQNTTPSNLSQAVPTSILITWLRIQIHELWGFILIQTTMSMLVYVCTCMCHECPCVYVGQRSRLVVISKALFILWLC